MEEGYLSTLPSFSTMAIHVGQDPNRWKTAPVVPPIITSTTFKQTAPGEHKGFEYGRAGNPTRSMLEECLAALDGGSYALTFASGLAAVSAIVSLLNSGDHIVTGRDIYGGTLRFFTKIATNMGLETTFVDLTNVDNLKNAISDNTKLIWMETPTNPLLSVIDIAAVSKTAKEKNQDIIVTVDNTFSTPYLQRPIEFGADIVVYSLTKYMNGHSDVIMGATVTRNEEIYKKLQFIQFAVGAIPSPFDCYLVNRSIKTLALRMQQHNKSSIFIALWLQKHSKVTNVYHPGLPTHPNHDIAKRQTCGHSGVVSFKHVGGLEESRKFLCAVRIFTLAESLGGYESLAGLPAIMTHASLTPKHREEIGITDSLVRLSVGLEDTEDLIQDIEQALDAAFKP